MTRVLIVDEDHDDRRLLRTTLQARHFEVIEARHGSEALTKALARPPHVIVSDLLVPDRHGARVPLPWKSADRLRQVPVIVYTATYTEAKDQRLAAALGADAVLARPAEPDALVSLIREVVARTDDIDASLAAEHRLSAAPPTADLMRAVADGMSDAVYVKDRDGTYLLFNEAAARFVGKAADDVLGKDDTAIFDPDSARVARESDRLVMESNRAQLRQEVLTAAGVTRVYEAVKTPYRDAQGAVLGVIGVSRDITDRKQAEEALRQQQALLRIAGRVSRIGGWSLDLPTQRLTWSDEVAAIHEEPIGHRPTLAAALAYYTPDDRPQVEAAVQACASSGAPFDVEARMLTATGRLLWVRAIGEAVRDPQGAVVSLQGAFQDISDRKLAEDQHRRLAERLTTTLESITDGFVTLDRDWRVSYVNAEAERLLRRSRDSLVGQSVWSAFPDAAGGAVERECRRAVEQNVSVDIEEFVASLDTWFSVRAYPSEQGLAVNFRDVTAARAAEQAVRLNEERFRLLSRATSDVVWEWDLLADTRSWNEGVTTLFGYRPEDIEPRAAFFTDRVHPDDLEALRATVHRAAEGVAESWSAEYRFRRRDGGYTPVLDSGYVVRDGDGRPVRMLGGMKDLTERRRAEESLLLRERAIEAVSQGIVVTGPDQGVVFVSGGFERMTGYRSEDVIGRNCRFLQGADTDPDMIREMREAIAAAASYSGEMLNYRKDGTPFWNQLSIAPVVGAAGQVTHFVGVQTDVTEKRRLEEQYRQAQKMEAVGRLAGGVAHDFNNLLTLISGNSEVLLAMPGLDPIVRDAVVSISEAGEQAASLTRQLLGFSRKSLLQPRVLDLNAVVSQTSSLLRRLIGEDIRLTTALDPALGRVRVDPGQLDQVLMNLAVNARDAMPTGGQLTIETRNVVLGDGHLPPYPDRTSGPHVMLAISDTGCGMSPDVLARIFEPFYTTKGVGHGTGLGLAMVFGIVEQSGGRIHVTSAVDHGSTFTLYFPTVSEPLSKTVQPDRDRDVRGTETVLVVEDEERVRALASLALSAYGYRVVVASDGDDALRVAAAHPDPLHLLLTDVVMPNLGGPQLAERLTAAMPGLKVLFMSGYTDDAVVRHGLIEASAAFIQKPYTPLELARRVRQVLDAPPGQPRMMP